MRPAAATRLGVSYKAIAARNPRIIYAFGPGYRQDGPRRDDPAFDDVVQGESGIAALVAQVIGEPRYYPTVIVDKFCGYMLASSIGMALFHRERTGQGQEVQVPMYETILSFNYLDHLWSAAFDPPMGHGVGYVRLLTTHRRPYKTKDGYICVLAVNDDQWRRLFPVLGRPELAEDERFAKTSERVHRYDELYGIVSEQLALRTTAEWRELLDKIEIPNGPMRSLQGTDERSVPARHRLLPSLRTSERRTCDHDQCSDALLSLSGRNAPAAAPARSAQRRGARCDRLQRRPKLRC